VSAKRADTVSAAVAPEMSASGGGSAGNRTVADVLMGNARAAASKTKKASPSLENPQAKTDRAKVELEVQAVPSPAKSPKLPVVITQFDDAKENSLSPKRS
jgi:DNA ligase 1